MGETQKIQLKLSSFALVLATHLRAFGLEFGIRMGGGWQKVRATLRKGKILYFSVCLWFRKIIRTARERSSLFQGD